MHRSRIQIIATISPKSGTPDVLAKLYDAGMDVIRLNMSWGTYEEHEGFVRDIRTIAQQHNTDIPVIVDLSGPRLQEDTGHRFNPDEQDILTEKDKNDIAFAARVGAEYIAQSYIATASDIELLRALIAQQGGTQRIIAKIERQEAVDAYDNILAASDAIMIARGDLGLAVPLEEIPFIQKDLIARANQAGKPVIVATEMMSSMIHSSTPTRAEVTDVAYAAITGADAVMLSNETATGEYPLETVAMMERVLRAAEKRTTGVRVRAF